MNYQIDRREFLKILSLLPLLQLNLPEFIGQKVNSAPNSSLPNILILVYDALSADHLWLNGYPRRTTPNLERFAERSIVYHNHYAGGNFTSSGTASLFTGTYPWSHRAIHLHGTVLESYKKKNIFSLFAEKGYHRSAYSHNLLVTSLLHQFREDIKVLTRTRELCLVDDQYADLLFPNDFNTAFWSEWLTLRGSENSPGSLFLSLVYRLYRTFHKQEISEKYGDLFPRGIPNLHNLYFILEDAIDWIAAQLKILPQPYLAYYHLLPPHEPYTTRKDFIGVFSDGWKPESKPILGFSKNFTEQELVKTRVDYDEYLAYADAEFGRLYDYIIQEGILDNTVLIFTSDHGELFERGIRGHVTPTLYQPITRIPLLISLPGQSHREDVYTSTSCVDLLPSLLMMTEQPIPDWCEGEVLPLLGGELPTSERSIFSVEAKSNPKLAPLNKATISLVNDRYKIIRYSGYKDGEISHELYNVAEDPEEREDIFSSSKSLASDMEIMLDEKLKEVNQGFE